MKRNPTYGLEVANPSSPGSGRPAKFITDRAKRYRANATAKDINWGKGAPRCQYCGRPGRLNPRPAGQRSAAGWKPVLMIDHVDGNEANGNPRNLARACRSCNTTKGAHYAKIGKGKRTAQYNPAGKGARSYQQYVTAVLSLKGESDAMPFQEARELVHNTSAARRTEFAKEIYALAKRKGNRPGRKKRQTEDEVPF